VISPQVGIRHDRIFAFRGNQAQFLAIEIQAYPDIFFLPR